jgi:glycosyltransferase involved in cell wall biosynthesis
MVGDTGRVVPPGEPAALADALYALLSEGSERLRALGAEARHRIENGFSIERMIRSYEQTYTDVLQRA